MKNKFKCFSNYFQILCRKLLKTINCVVCEQRILKHGNASGKLQHCDIGQVCVMMKRIVRVCELVCIRCREKRESGGGGYVVWTLERERVLLCKS